MSLESRVTVAGSSKEWSQGSAQGEVRSGKPARNAVAYRLVTDGVPLLLLVIWYVASLSTAEYILPNPIGVFNRTLQLLAGVRIDGLGVDFDPALLKHTYTSLARVLASSLLALVIGSGLVLMARYLLVAKGLVIERLLPTLNAFPTLGWAILGLYWFGATNGSVIFVEVAILLPFTMINVWEGLKMLDAETMEMAYSFTRDRWRVLRKIILPLLLPYVFAAMRISYGVGWKVGLIAELFGASVGLGFELNYARSQFDSTMLFATIVTLVVLVHVVDKLVFGRLERRILAYRDAGSAVR